MAKYLKLDHVLPRKDDGDVEISFWDAGKDDYISVIVVEEDIVSFDEREALQKKVDELTAELEKVKAEKEKLESDYDRLVSTKDERITELKERICIMSGEKETYKECIDIITSKICECIK